MSIGQTLFGTDVYQAGRVMTVSVSGLDRSIQIVFIRDALLFGFGRVCERLFISARGALSLFGASCLVWPISCRLRGHTARLFVVSLAASKSRKFKIRREENQTKKRMRRKKKKKKKTKQQ